MLVGLYMIYNQIKIWMIFQARGKYLERQSLEMQQTQHHLDVVDSC